MKNDISYDTINGSLIDDIHISYVDHITIIMTKIKQNLKKKLYYIWESF